MYEKILKLAKHYELLALSSEILNTVKTHCPQLLPPTGGLVGKGQQGEVYDMGDRVLKIQRVMDEDIADDKIIELYKLQRLNSELYPIIDHIQKLCSSENEFYYYYIMEKLTPAEGAEEIAKILRSKIEGKSIMRLHESPYFDKALELYEKMENSGTIHIDVNPGAIMQDINGGLKLADVDSVVSTQ